MRLIKVNTILSCVFVAGCASTQLNNNALDLSSTIDKLVIEQVIYNLDKFSVDSDSIPSQAAIAAGSVTTTGQVQAQVSDPINNVIATTRQVAQVVTSRTTTRQATTLSATAQNQFNQNWTLDPLSESEPLRRVKALYRFATARCSTREQREEAQQRLICEYAPITKSGSDGGGAVKVDLSACFKIKSGLAEQKVSADPAFLQRPSCVLCTGQKALQVVVNERLDCGWLNLSSRREAPEGSVILKSGASGDLYLDPHYRNTRASAILKYADEANARAAFSEFVLFVTEATSQGSSGTGNSKAGRGKAFFTINTPPAL